MPHVVIRRALIAPVVFLADAALLVASPVLALVALLAAPFTGGWRPLRMLAIVLAFAARHLAAGLACTWLWVRSGGGRWLDPEAIEAAHYRLLRWFVTGIYRTIERVARVEVRVTESAAAEEALASLRRPVVVLARHAGEGDTLLVLEHLLNRHGRRPRVVMHERLRLDPVIDVLGERLPNRFVDPRGGDTEVEIAAMARGLDARGALLIFPEGRNFSEQHRRRGIERLEAAGFARQAEWAREMHHMSAPRPGGALAAIDALPGADIVFVSHVGFPTSLGQVWRLLPSDQAVEVRLWTAPADEVPAGQVERIDWLFAWWRTLDAWVGERVAGRAPGRPNAANGAGRP